jgi:glutathione S-transferase
MNYVDLVAILAVIQLVFFGVLVARARGRYQVKAPAVTGHELFERMYRVQMNTVELIVCFLPALYVAAKYWAPGYVAIAGAVYLVGRMVYWRAYTEAPAKRELGFALSMAPTVALLLAALVGIVRAAAA